MPQKIDTRLEGIRRRLAGVQRHLDKALRRLERVVDGIEAEERRKRPSKPSHSTLRSGDVPVQRDGGAT